MRSQTVSRSVMMMFTLFLTGCKYNGSFLQMNSDAPMPFLGLQLSVQADRANETPQQRSVGTDTRIAAVEANLPGFSNTSSVNRPNQTLTHGTHGNVVVAADRSHHKEAAKPQTLAPAKHNVGLATVGLVPVSRVSEFQSHVRYSLSEAVTESTMNAQEVQLRLNGF